MKSSIFVYSAKIPQKLQLNYQKEAIMNPFYQLPPQQILEANGKASIDALRMSPNSSVLIADRTAPIIWKCVSDSIGNVTAEAWDITRHKDEAEVQQENLNALLISINQRLEDMEAKYESITTRLDKSDDGEFQTGKNANAGGKKSAGANKSSSLE